MDARPFLRRSSVVRLKSRKFLKNEATDLIDNKGSALGRARNEATDSVLGFQSLSEPNWVK